MTNMTLQKSNMGITVFLLALLSVTKASSSVKCSINLEYCSCDDVLSCPPYHLPAKALVLSHGNNLEIRPGTFRNMSLKSVSLYKTTVRVMDCDAFLGLEETLETITLSDVYFPHRNLPLCALSNLRNLKIINIRNTRIHHFGQEPLATTKLQSLTLRGVGLKTFTHNSLFALFSLDLSRNRLTESVYGEVGHFLSLQTLDLSNNKLKELPSPNDWQNLQILKSVSFRNNKICHIKEGTFFQNTNSSETVKFDHIDIRGNGISAIHSAAFSNAYVGRLLLSDNPLGALENDVRVFKGLNVRHLYLANASLSVLPSGFFDSLKNLTFLDLSGNRLSEAEWLTPSVCRSLAYLDIRGNRFSNFPSRCPADASIATVDLRSNILKMVDNGHLRVGRLLLSHNRLVSGNLTVGLGSYGTIYLDDNLLTRLAPITVVISKDDPMFHGLIDVSANAMRQLPAINLQLDGNAESNQIQRISLIIVTNGNTIQHLKPLQIEHVSNELTSIVVDVNVKHQHNHLSIFPSCEFFENHAYFVSELDLSYNAIKHIALENCQLGRLKVLHLNYNDIITFTLAKSVGHDLRILSLRGNRISRLDESFFEILDGLYSLDLRDNNLVSFPDVSGALPQLAWIKLNGNPIKCDCNLLWMINGKLRLDGLRCDSTTTSHGHDARSFVKRNCSPPSTELQHKPVDVRHELETKKKKPFRAFTPELDPSPDVSVTRNAATLPPKSSPTGITGINVAVYPGVSIHGHDEHVHAHRRIIGKDVAVYPGVAIHGHDEHLHGHPILSMKDVIMIALASVVPVIIAVLFVVTVLYCRLRSRENKKQEQERIIQMNKLFSMRRQSGFDGFELRRPSDAGGFGLRRPSMAFELPFPRESTIMEKQSPPQDDSPFVEISLEPETEGTYKLYPAITKHLDKPSS